MSYLRFLNLVQALRQFPSYPVMDATEARLLNALAVVWSRGQQITVLEAMKMLPDASASSIHRRLKTLRHKGFIALVPDNRDNRIKYVQGTALFDNYVSAMDACLQQAVQS